MGGAAIPSGTCREITHHINLGQEFKIVSGTNRGGFHKVLARVYSEAGTHEDI